MRTSLPKFPNLSKFPNNNNPFLPTPYLLPYSSPRHSVPRDDDVLLRHSVPWDDVHHNNKGCSRVAV